MTARPFCGWQLQDNGADRAGRAGGRGEGDLRRAGRACTARAAPTPACMRWGRSRIAISPSISCPAGFATGSTRICGRIRSACCRPTSCPMTSRRGSRPRSATTSTASPIAAPISRSTSARSGGCRGRSTPTRCTRPRSGWSASIDFTTFRDTECQAKSPEKTLDQLDVVRDGDAVNIVTSARSFLHSQVRSMVGSLVWVGEGRWSADDLQKRSTPATAPPAARSRRRTGCIWCGWIIDLAALRRWRSARWFIDSAGTTGPRNDDGATRNTGRARRDRSSSAFRDPTPACARRSGAWSGRPGRTRSPGNSSR